MSEKILILIESNMGLNHAGDIVSPEGVYARRSDNRLVALAASTLTITQELHDAKTIVVNRAAGSTITLPSASGSGAKYRFFVLTTITSNALIIKVANASDSMRGNALVCQDGGSSVVGFEAAANDDTITMDGSTTGGIRGDLIEIEDIATNLFYAKIISSGTGTEATPFSATVS